MTASQGYLPARIGLACLTAFLFLLACSGANEAPPTVESTPTLDPEIEARATIASCDFYLEVADTSQERAQGLMERESLGKDRGMLFIFENEQTLNFWMKNTLIPLDILFIDENLVVVDVQSMRSEHESASGSLPIYASATPAMYAIEVNEGVAKECGIEPGASVLLREISPDAGQ